MTTPEGSAGAAWAGGGGAAGCCARPYGTFPNNKAAVIAAANCIVLKQLRCVTM
jgi:hypothetical protein